MPTGLPAFSVSGSLSEEKAGFSWQGSPTDTSLSLTFTGWLNGNSAHWENKKTKIRTRKRYHDAHWAAVHGAKVRPWNAKGNERMTTGLSHVN